MNPVNRNGQQGAVLVIALLFLTILTILGVTAMTATTYEERLAGNARDAGAAFQAAEAALRDARRDLNGIVIPPFAVTDRRNPPISGKTGFGDGTADADNGTCGTGTTAPQTIGLCRPLPYNGATGTPPPFNTQFFTGTMAAAAVTYGRYTGAPELKGVRVQPQYYIEVMCLPQFGGSLGDPNYCNFYRITGRGWGLNPNTQVTVQEIFLRM
jgi:type IV pilus assembly protein PilX